MFVVEAYVVGEDIQGPVVGECFGDDRVSEGIPG